jgi:hypothetical protein
MVKQIVSRLHADDKARSKANGKILLAAAAREAGNELRSRYADVMARIPKEQHPLALVMLRDDAITTEQIIKACEIAAGPTKGAEVQNNPQQALYAEGYNAARALMGLPPEDPLQAFADAPPCELFYEELYGEGEAAAKELFAFMKGTIR